MKKNIIKNFIKLYYLNGINESSIWKYDNNLINVELISSCRSLITSIKTKKNIIDLKDDIAIFNNALLLNLINLFDDNDEKFKIEIDERKIKFFGSNKIKPIFTLADKDIIQNDGSEFFNKCETLSEWNSTFKLNKEDINLLSKSKNALPDAKILFVNEKQLIIGNDTHNDNRIEFKIDNKINELFEEKIFDINYFITIISLLEDEVICSIHDRGMLKIEKETDDFICTYYLMALQQ